MNKRIYQESCANCGEPETDLESEYAATYDGNGDAICDECGAGRGIFVETTDRAANELVVRLRGQLAALREALEEVDRAWEKCEGNATNLFLYFGSGAFRVGVAERVRTALATAAGKRETEVLRAAGVYRDWIMATPPEHVDPAGPPLSPAARGLVDAVDALQAAKEIP